MLQFDVTMSLSNSSMAAIVLSDILKLLHAEGLLLKDIALLIRHAG